MSRIINRQRQLAEQGRIRLGYTAEGNNGKTRPVRSETFILTSHSQEHIEHAAALWGGAVEHWQPMGNGVKQYRVITNAKSIPAILPPGDPLTQAYEQWTKGGCQRRCDGVTEQFSGSPCLCLAEHGDQWYELGARTVCVSKSRLKVLLPDMQGLGAWRMETGSFYATDEIAGMVDTIRGAVGDQVLVPVTLRIEPRTRVSGGQTKQFVVPVLELRGVTAGALLSGQAAQIGAIGTAHPTTPPAAIEASLDPYAEVTGLVESATTLDELAGIWDQARTAQLVGSAAPDSPRLEAFVAAWKAKAHLIKDATQHPAGEDGVVDAEVVDDGDADTVWQQILTTAGSLPTPMALAEVQGDFQGRYGMSAAVASAAELRVYLDELSLVTA
jgi:hypothetical protein